MICNITAKFNVGDKVTIAPNTFASIDEIEWRGDWCKDNIPNILDDENEDLDCMDFFSPSKYNDNHNTEEEFIVSEVLVREEQSLNGARYEAYYKLENQGDKCIREDLLSGVGEIHSNVIYLSDTCWKSGTSWLIQYQSEITRAQDLNNLGGFSVFNAYNKSVQTESVIKLTGELMVDVKGIWHTEKYAVLELHRYDESSGLPNVYLTVDKNGNLKFAYTGNRAICIGDGTDFQLTEETLVTATFSTFKEFFNNIEILNAEEIETDPDWI